MPSVILSKEVADELRGNLMDALGVGFRKEQKPITGPVAIELDEATASNLLAALDK